MNRSELINILGISILLTLGFPPFPFGILVPPALSLFILFIWDRSSRDAFRLGYWLGLIWGAMTLFWIAASTLTGAIFAVTINALHYAIVWWLFIILKMTHKYLALTALPFIWTAMEYLRIFTDIRFNWMTLGYTQTYYLKFIQIIDVTGMWIISFLLLTFSILLFLAFHEQSKKFKWIAYTGILIPLILLYYHGTWRINGFDSKSHKLIKASLVQPNVDPFEKWDPLFQKEAFEMLMIASEKLVSQNPAIIVWPETATPFYLRTRPQIIKKLNQFVDSTGIALLTGTPDYQYDAQEEDYRTYNAAFFFRPNSIGFSSYYKMALVPAAESMPFKSTLPFLRKLDVGGGDFFPGHTYKVFAFTPKVFLGKYKAGKYRVSNEQVTELDTVRLSSVICYESVFPQFVRQFIEHGANLLTIITNDGWFGLTSGPYQHSQYGVLRAIESRVSIIRCANTGISSFIDPVGRKLEKAALNTRKDLVSFMPLRAGETYYSKNGDWFAKITLYVALAFLFIKFISWMLFERKKIETGK